MKINEIIDGEKIEILLLISNVTKGISTNNATYLNITFQDSTGVIEGKRWDATQDDIDFYTIGKIVRVFGDANKYRNAMQIKISHAEAVDMSAIDYQDYVASAPVKREDLEQELRYFVTSLKDSDVKLMVVELLKKYYTPYLTHPAATRNHHEYCSGLLHHSVNVAKLADVFANFYSNVDRDLLVGAALLHDVGKVIELSGPIIPTYTTEGRLIGHISIMQAEIREMAHKLQITSEVPMLLEHMILSHHGKKEFGSPVLPMTREALMLNIVDDIDAKMNILDKALDGVEDGKFTTKIYPLDDRSFYKPFKR